MLPGVTDELAASPVFGTFCLPCCSADVELARVVLLGTLSILSDDSVEFLYKTKG